MSDRFKMAADWTTSKVSCAAGATYGTAKHAASPVLGACASVSKVVTAKSKDIAGVAAASVAAQAAVVPALNIVGFKAAGIAAGSWAASCMSWYGALTPAGGPFRPVVVIRGTA